MDGGIHLGFSAMCLTEAKRAAVSGAKPDNFPGSRRARIRSESQGVGIRREKRCAVSFVRARTGERMAGMAGALWREGDRTCVWDVGHRSHQGGVSIEVRPGHMGAGGAHIAPFADHHPIN